MSMGGGNKHLEDETTSTVGLPTVKVLIDRLTSVSFEF